MLPSDLLRAVTSVLRPIVRLLIRAGVTFPILADALRTVYVEVASAEAAGSRPVTDSRLSVLTGIHRKELRRQRAGGDPAEPALVTLHSQLIARWLGDPAYADAAGGPAPLPRTGPAPSFEALVGGVTRDIRSRTVLDEWLAGGTASLDPAGRVVLLVAAFVPEADSASRLFYFGRNLRDHAEAAAANITSPGAAPFLERSVHYDRLGPEAAAALEQLAREAAGAVLLDVNRAALALADADEAGTPAAERTRRVNFGLYVYAETAPDA